MIEHGRQSARERVLLQRLPLRRSEQRGMQASACLHSKSSRVVVNMLLLLGISSDVVKSELLTACWTYVQCYDACFTATVQISYTPSSPRKYTQALVVLFCMR